MIKIEDVKCPDSGEVDSFDPTNLAAVDKKDEIKFVVSSRRDFEFALDFTRRHNFTDRTGEVIFSPVFANPVGAWPGLDPRELAERILADGLPVRLGLQPHKFIRDAAMKGV